MTSSRLKNRLHNILKVIVILCAVGLLVSCETFGYYSQAARGQLSLLMNRQSIEEMLSQDDIEELTREKLETVLRARDFAIDELGLEPGGNYLTYVDIQRPHVVWNVFAAPEFSVRPVEWCYPVAGCVSYRGFFSEDQARAYAQQLEVEGFDVYVGPVDAYSTLGWFNDSVLSTIINRPEHRLVSLIFHELAHQQLYVPGDTTFNESFATLVAQEGLKRWLARSQQYDVIARAEQEDLMQQQFVDVVALYRGKLKALYALSEITDEEKRRRKESLKSQLRAEHEALMESWGYRGYQKWFSGPLNNAQLTTVASYNDLVPALRILLQASANDLEGFYDQAAVLAGLPRAERRLRLDYLVEAGRGES